MKKIFLLATYAALSLGAAAQHVQFEEADYKSVGVYDSWEASPFRNGELTGNCAVVDNPYRDEVNDSEKVLGFQRSRYGSNLYGARIDLKETFELTTTTQYVHVMLHKPNTTRVMLIGLGKRQDRAGQSEETEQFWERCNTTVNVLQDEWFDAVFAIKGNGGIDIHSLVVVVDATSPHDMTEDFVAYIDDIEVNSSVRSRTEVLGDYYVNFSKTQTYTRTDRKVNSVSLTSPSGGQQTASVAGDLCYNEVFTPTFNVKAGESVTPAVGYTGSWMHSYIYIDKGQDGQFSYDVDANGGASAESDLVSFSYYSGVNSLGTAQSSGNVLAAPAFTIPANLAKGIYRMRYKVDWDTLDPGGNDGSVSNYIIDNGGGIVDVRLNVHEDEVNIRRSGGLNGDIVYTTGEDFVSETIPFGQAYTIKMKPAEGFSINYLTIRHGYGLTGDSLVHSTPQFVDEVIQREEFAADGTFTIPASYIDGDVLLMPEFVSTADIKPVRHLTYAFQWNGVTKATQEVSYYEGDEFPDIDFSLLPSYTAADKPEGVMTADLDGTTVEIAVRAEGLPFLCYDAVDAVSQWYFLGITASPKYLYDPAEGTSISLTYSAPEVVDNTFQWAFVGSPFDGYRIYNRETGEVLASAVDNISTNTGGKQYPNTQPEASLPSGWYDVWNVLKSAEYDDGFYLALQAVGDNAYKMNSRDDLLAFWTGGQDAGSAFRVSLTFPELPCAVQDGESFYGTAFLPCAARIPDGVEAYIAGTVQDGVLPLGKIVDGVVPEMCGVVLKSYAEAVQFEIAAEQGSVSSTLSGTLAASTPAGAFATLQSGAQGLGFYGQTSALAANTAFLATSDAFTALDFEAGVDGISAVSISTEVDGLYDLSGRRLENLKTRQLENLPKGVYIREGEKVIVR